MQFPTSVTCTPQPLCHISSSKTPPPNNRAFSTIQALESAYFRATGKPLLLSEQHFLNCAWNVPQNHGCFGGDQDMALEWVFEQGVIATEEALPYLGVFDYCPSNLTGYVRFEGHWSLVEPGM